VIFAPKTFQVITTPDSKYEVMEFGDAESRVVATFFREDEARSYARSRVAWQNVLSWSHEMKHTLPEDALP
jgi:hypothetical protein